MQTFLPLPAFDETFACLDSKRLGKQRVEARQIWNCLQGNTVGWKNHPAILMWFGYEDFLAHYHNWSLIEWMNRGYENNMELLPYSITKIEDVLVPPWFGEDRFHSSHRAALLAKNFEHYKQFGWTEEPKIEYFWPTKNT